jgi:photosystem II stability/assembly factor-like uncharacterized protein
VLRRVVALAGVICACAVGVVSAGVTWRDTSGSSVPSALVPNAIAFWDADHGLVGTGFRYCEVGRCGGGTISETTDGGRTSRVRVRTAGPVSWLSVAPGGSAWAVVDHCSATRGCLPTRFFRTSDGGRTWQRLPRLVLRPSFADRLHGFALAGGSCEPAWCLGAKLLATADGGGTWHRLVSPCRGDMQDVSAVRVSRAWLLCASQPGAGNQGKAIYRTSNGGRTWQRLLALQIGKKSAGGISWYGYALGISFAPGGVGLLWESRGTLYLTRDGGRQWKPLPAVARPEVAFGSSASVVTGKAFALLYWGNHSYRLIATTHGYRDWHTVRTWRYQPN